MFLSPILIFLLVFVLSIAAAVAFSPSNFEPKSKRVCLIQLSATNTNKKSPLKQLRNVFESAQASVQDYLLMRPARQVPPGMRRVPTQFIAALGDPTASSGANANEWGIWTLDPGPRGIYLTQFNSKMKQAPAGWKWDPNEFWIEEYGRIMEKPTFPLPPGRYLVTGGRAMTTLLTIDPPNGNERQQRWTLQDGTLFDVTHLPCRAARYNPDGKGKHNIASPANAKVSDFPVAPGASMPPIEGCSKQDYAVLFVLAVDNDM